jgi:hypothetical protein
MIAVNRDYNSANQISEDLHNVRTKGAAPVLQRAVVIDVLYDPDALTQEERQAISETVNNPELVDVAPINSVIAMITSNAGGVSSQNNTILFPFFSSHILLPVKPGETVYVIYEDYKDTGATLGYWLTRIGSQRTIEDVNHTHHDRMYQATFNPSNYETADTQEVNQADPSPGFPNGAGTEETRTLAVDTSTDKKIEPYDQIREQAKASPLVTPEPVPRWKKRPQDTVFQGSNNALVSFGEDRTGPIESATDAKGQAGTIDVVVGRGRTLPASDTEEPTNGAPRVIKNSREQFETNKAPYQREWGRKDAPDEGNPNFKDDATRIYISMQTNGDENFGLTLNENTPADNLSLPELPETGTYNKAHLIKKSDHIRLIARKDDENGVAGTMLLVREGVADEDLGYFFINENGHIQIESPKIYLGRSVKEEEPVVLFTRFRETTMQLQAQIDAIEARFINLCTALETAFAGPGNLGQPLPGLKDIGSPLIKTEREEIEKDLDPLKDRVLEESDYKSQSKKLYVE